MPRFSGWVLTPEDETTGSYGYQNPSTDNRDSAYTDQYHSYQGPGNDQLPRSNQSLSSNYYQTPGNDYQNPAAGYPAPGSSYYQTPGNASQIPGISSQTAGYARAPSNIFQAPSDNKQTYSNSYQPSINAQNRVNSPNPSNSYYRTPSNNRDLDPDTTPDRIGPPSTDQNPGSGCVRCGPGRNCRVCRERWRRERILQVPRGTSGVPKKWKRRTYC